MTKLNDQELTFIREKGESDLYPNWGIPYLTKN